MSVFVPTNGILINPRHSTCFVALILWETAALERNETLRATWFRDQSAC